jgi:hypothetical protein
MKQTLARMLRLLKPNNFGLLLETKVSTLRSLVKRGKFPQPVEVRKRCARRRETDSANHITQLEL